MVKKIFKILGIIFILLLAAIIVLPMVFKDDIIAKVKEEINNNVNAQVDFGDFDLSLISSFPDFTFSIEEISGLFSFFLNNLSESISEFTSIKKTFVV